MLVSAVSDNADLASRLRSTLPDDFVESFESLRKSHEIEIIDFDHLEELKMHFELLTVLDELARVEKLWAAGVEEMSGCVRSND